MTENEALANVFRVFEDARIIGAEPSRDARMPPTATGCVSTA